MAMKQFKDPIYGYINIPKTIVKDIIDTAEFQRLRYIKQTSYLPVYSAALHNRFIHSLGVYHLGKMASDAVFNNSKEILERYSTTFDIKQTFQLACLLHDVGHAPFSHSGESFYVDGEGKFYAEFKNIVQDESFSLDVDYYHSNGKTAAPHEIMSVIIALKNYKDYFKSDEERSFFARCITGYKYRDLESEKGANHAIFNAFISLLNSTTIDVDRLDYLIRDAYVMGYNSVSIDYQRLLEGIMLVKVQGTVNYSPIQLAYKKSALSVIENVIYAHDAEKKWIQNHPVILYEVFLIQRIIVSTRMEYKKRTGNELFSIRALSSKNDERTEHDKHFPVLSKELAKIKSLLLNVEHKDEILGNLQIIEKHIETANTYADISLLCDDDIIHLSKTIDQYFSNELFNRGIRRHPIWKSESEYKIYMDGFIGDESYDELQSQIKVLYKFLLEEAPSPAIDSEAVDYCQKRLEEICALELSEYDKIDMTTRYSMLLKWLKMFEKIADEQNLRQFDFRIIPASQFDSSFKKEDLGNIPIFFFFSGKIYPLSKLINLFTVNDTKRHKFFYVYYRKNPGEEIDAPKVGKEIAKLIVQ